MHGLCPRRQRRRVYAFPEALSNRRRWYGTGVVDAVSPCRVLVIDDEKDNADTLVTLLQLWGHQATAAYSGDEAITRASVLQPEIVITDLVMPVVSGFDLVRRLRERFPSAKFIALTGWHNRETVQRCRAAGFEKVLLKPATGAQLKAAVRHGGD
jgi:CheY-like chemotaxis protein